jgi:hypothetical protein
MNRRAFLQNAIATAVAATVPAPALFADPGTPNGQPGWWMVEPIRWLQTNLRETNAALNPRQFIAGVASFNANVLMMSAGGITALYPSNVQYHYVSPYMPKGQDTFGEVLREAHAHKIRVVSRWDFSKTHKDVFDAHPDWFFKMADGQPATYNGLYLACINGGWYRQKSIEILSEALDRYDVDGCFFNFFSNPTTDYSEHQLGLCHCDNCQRLYHERFHRDVPEAPDADYHAFLHDAGVSMSLAIRTVVKTKRPQAALLGTSVEIGDIAYGEANTAVRRPLPLWPYSAGDSSNQWRNSYPDKGVVCQGMSFIDFPWRFAVVPQPEIRTRIWQEVANGGAAAFNLHGTIADQQDRTAIDVAIPAYGWLKQHQEYFVGQTSEARVFLLAPRSGGIGFQISSDAYRGFYRFLTEQHIPFAAVKILTSWESEKPTWSSAPAKPRQRCKRMSKTEDASSSPAPQRRNLRSPLPSSYGSLPTAPTSASATKPCSLPSSKPTWSSCMATTCSCRRKAPARSPSFRPPCMVRQSSCTSTGKIPTTPAC